MNTPAVDYSCPECNSLFQLKSQSRPFGSRIVDAAYDKMRQAVLQDRSPNLFALHYVADSWKVWNLLLVPHFAFSLAVLERRNPLGPAARRAGWVGCNFLLTRIPSDAKISMVCDGVPVAASRVRDSYARLRPLQRLTVENRGWTLDVLAAVRSLGKREFWLCDLYAREQGLARLHPKNRHVRDKVRQQLQVLRDLGLLEFRARGHYRLT